MDNLWLDSLPQADRRRLASDLGVERFPQGAVLHEAGEATEKVWFPRRGVWVRTRAQRRT